MSSLVDQMLAGGTALHVEAFHGERITILTGDDAGKVFIAVKEIESDIVLDAVIGEDRRAKRIIRFRDGNVPVIAGQCVVKTEDGRKWNAVKAPQDGYLTTDFELREIVAGTDS